MRIVLLLLLAACPSSTPSKPTSMPGTTSDGTCADVTWSCVGMKPGTEDPWGCVEGNAAEAQQRQAACTYEKGGMFALNACLRDNVAGGCTLARGSSCTTTWYAAPATRQSVESECEKQGARFVAP